MTESSALEKLSTLIRYYILTSTTAAGSGHATSSLSAVELLTTLFFDGFLHFDVQHPENPANDRVIFSKGHAAPLLYSLYTAAGAIIEKELLTLRKFGSRLEGHPTLEFPYAEAVTGSLGQGLSMGVGFAMADRLDSGQQSTINKKVFVLLGDSEMAEGQNWEAMQIASHYKLNNLIGILDVNRLGQRGETMLGWEVEKYIERVEAFGWKGILVNNGHNVEEIAQALHNARESTSRPVMIVAKTHKGRGISFLEDEDNWHGKALNEKQLKSALAELGEVDKKVKGKIQMPVNPIQRNGGQLNTSEKDQIRALLAKLVVDKEQEVAKANEIDRSKKDGTREEYGTALVELGKKYRDVVVMDAEMANSTMSEKFRDVFPNRFFEMFIAEQNMVSAAVGFSRSGYIPFISTFGAFLTRAFDQIRMARYNKANINIIGSHAGLAATADGISQMALEDLSMFRSIPDSLVFYPADECATLKLVYQMYLQQGIAYMRTSKVKTPQLYGPTDEFVVGGSKVLRESKQDVCVIFSAGVPLFEALKAYELLKKEKIHVAIVDLYSIKPLDENTILQLSAVSKKVITVEDHYACGGLGEAINTALKGRDVETINLSVKKIPRSGSLEELLAYGEIDSKAIVKAVKSLIK